MMAREYLCTPVCRLRIEAEQGAIVCIERDDAGDLPACPDVDTGLAAQQLREYFGGTRQRFDLPLAPRGTPFQQAVWRALLAVPFGELTSYGALAAQVGCPRGARAVGGAVGRNPLLIVVPCHRVIAAGGVLGGFSAGLPVKRFLLAHEGHPEFLE